MYAYLPHRFTTRQAKEDFEYNGIRYKAGTCVLAPTLDIQRDERYWPNPMEFDPERYVNYKGSCKIIRFFFTVREYISPVATPYESVETKLRNK